MFWVQWKYFTIKSPIPLNIKNCSYWKKVHEWIVFNTTKKKKRICSQCKSYKQNVHLFPPFFSFRLCLIYNSFTGRNKKSEKFQRKEDSFLTGKASDAPLRPVTPCPSAVEYVTPVFARNYQGVWRYVVQIPYEGYFTQTVEVTQCL